MSTGNHCARWPAALSDVMKRSVGIFDIVLLDEKTKRSENNTMDPKTFTFSRDEMMESLDRVSEMILEHFTNLRGKPVTCNKTRQELDSIIGDTFPADGVPIAELLSVIESHVMSNIWTWLLGPAPLWNPNWTPDNRTNGADGVKSTILCDYRANSEIIVPAAHRRNTGRKEVWNNKIIIIGRKNFEVWKKLKWKT